MLMVTIAPGRLAAHRFSGRRCHWCEGPLVAPGRQPHEPLRLDPDLHYMCSPCVVRALLNVTRVLHGMLAENIGPMARKRRAEHRRRVSRAVNHLSASDDQRGQRMSGARANLLDEH